MSKKLLINGFLVFVVLLSSFIFTGDTFAAPKEESKGQTCIKTNTGNLGDKENKDNEGSQCGKQVLISYPTEPNLPITNTKPTAVINILPSLNVRVGTEMSYDASQSYDVDGDSIINIEWLDIQSSFSATGTYTVFLRVQDEHGLWSNWTIQDITVVE